MENRIQNSNNACDSLAEGCWNSDDDDDDDGDGGGGGGHDDEDGAGQMNNEAIDARECFAPRTCEAVHVTWSYISRRMWTACSLQWPCVGRR